MPNERFNGSILQVIRIEDIRRELPEIFLHPFVRTWQDAVACALHNETIQIRDKEFRVLVAPFTDENNE